MMKKVVIAIISFTVLTGMVACSNNDSNDPNRNEQNEINDQNVNTDENQANEDRDDVENNQSTENNGVAENEPENIIPEKLTDFEESATLVEQIEIGSLNAEIETDNQNNRVIIFSDESKIKKYKSIFIKKQNRLKIISLDNDGQIFNEVIE